MSRAVERIEARRDELELLADRDDMATSRVAKELLEIADAQERPAAAQ